MASKITSSIPESSFEKVRNRVAEILSNELPGQEYLLGVEMPTKAWVERLIPFDERTEFPAINVSVERLNFDGQDVRQSNNTITVNIDCYCNSTSNQNEYADKDAMFKLHTLVRVVRGVLEHNIYRTLDFLPPFIFSRKIQNVIFAKSNEQDANTGVFCRIVLEVKVAEQNGTNPPILLDKSETEVKINESEKGYYFEAVS